VSVQFACDVGLPIFVNLGEFFGKVDSVHNAWVDESIAEQVADSKIELAGQLRLANRTPLVERPFMAAFAR
jgi:hypothetical protein